MPEAMPVIFGPLDAPPPRVFETERLRLRAYQPGDAKIAFETYAGDKETTKYMSFKCPSRAEDLESFVSQVVDFFDGKASMSRHFAWLVSLKSTAEYIGSVGFGPSGDFRLSGGYILGRQYWGKGYAGEAWKCLVDWAKTQPRVYRIEAFHDIANPASGKVMLKAGMQFEGVLRSYGVHPNVSPLPRDVALYAWARESAH